MAEQVSQPKSKSTNISVSVVVPVYNGEQTIKSALQSIFKQTVLPKEIVVVDDGSTDKTAQVLQQITGPIPIRYIYQDNKRQAAARNNGVKNARGDFIAFLDADDRWLPNKLELQLSELKTNSDLDIVVGNYQINDLGTEKKFVPDVLPAAPANTAALLEANFFWLPAVLVRRSAFLEVGGFDEAFRNAEDVELGFRLCKQYKWRFINDVVAVYERRAFSSSNQEAHDIAGVLQFYRKLEKRGDLTDIEKRLLAQKHQFWQRRERMFLVRQAAVTKGQLAGLLMYFRQVFGRILSLKALGLLVLLLIPGSIGYLKKTRWAHLDYSN